MRNLAVAAIVLAIATPALAQNASQISAASRGANCSGCNLFQADFSRKELRNRNYSGARLRQSDLTGVIMSGANFTGADFAGANLTNASFVGAYLQGARFSGANLAGVNFSGAEMDRASGLTQAQLNKACGDDATTLPRGLTLRSC